MVSRRYFNDFLQCEGQPLLQMHILLFFYVFERKERFCFDILYFETFQQIKLTRTTVTEKNGEKYECSRHVIGMQTRNTAHDA